MAGFRESVFYKYSGKLFADLGYQVCYGILAVFILAFLVLSLYTSLKSNVQSNTYMKFLLMTSVFMLMDIIPAIVPTCVLWKFLPLIFICLAYPFVFLTVAWSIFFPGFGAPGKASSAPRIFCVKMTRKGGVQVFATHFLAAIVLALACIAGFFISYAGTLAVGLADTVAVEESSSSQAKILRDGLLTFLGFWNVSLLITGEGAVGELIMSLIAPFVYRKFEVKDVMAATRKVQTTSHGEYSYEVSSEGA